MRKAITDLPLNGRNPLNLLIYEPGVVQRSGNTVNVNGARAMAVKSRSMASMLTNPVIRTRLTMSSG